MHSVLKFLADLMIYHNWIQSVPVHLPIKWRNLKVKKTGSFVGQVAQLAGGDSWKGRIVWWYRAVYVGGSHLCIVVYCNLRHSGWFDWQWRISNWRTKERRFPKWCSRNFVWYALKYSRRMLIPNHIDELHKRKYFMRMSRFCSRYAPLTYKVGTKSMAS